MELNFVQSSEVFGKNTLAWETEFEATGDFNLHVERNKGGDILVYQRTAGSGYAIVEEFRGMDNKPAIDLDFTSVVYPKFIKIVSESQPTYATVTTDGEITEIKSQSKEVEVTANGTMDITPDAGFSYLNSVKVKTNVPTSGGSGSGSAEYHYLQFISSYAKDYIQYATECKGDSLGVIALTPTFILEGEEAMSLVSSAKFDFNAYSSYSSEGKVTVGSMVEHLIGSYFKEITKEEFYNLNA